MVACSDGMGEGFRVLRTLEDIPFRFLWIGRERDIVEQMFHRCTSWPRFTHGVCGEVRFELKNAENVPRCALMRIAQATPQATVSPPCQLRSGIAAFFVSKIVILELVQFLTRRMFLRVHRLDLGRGSSLGNFSTDEHSSSSRLILAYNE